MSPRPDCAQVRELAPDVALGIVSGDERALVLDHLATCSDCRRELAELGGVVDQLLLLAPSVEPPAGFESAVLDSLDRARRPRRRPARLVAAALAGAVVVGAVAFVATSSDRTLAADYRAALAEANGKYFSVTALVDETSAKVGHVFAYEGDPSWLVVVVLDEAETYDVELVTEGGRAMALGIFEASPARRAWGVEIPVPVHDIGRITLRSATETYRGTF